MVVFNIGLVFLSLCCGLKSVAQLKTVLEWWAAAFLFWYIWLVLLFELFNYINNHLVKTLQVSSFESVALIQNVTSLKISY